MIDRVDCKRMNDYTCARFDGKNALDEFTDIDSGLIFAWYSPQPEISVTIGWHNAAAETQRLSGSEKIGHER